MSIIRDNKEVVAVYDGQQPISHIYSGERLIFGNKERDYIKTNYILDSVGRNIKHKFEDILDELVDLHSNEGAGYAVYTLADNELNKVRSSTTNGFGCSCISRQYRLYSYKANSTGSHYIYNLDTNKYVLTVNSYSSGVGSYEFQHNGNWYVYIDFSSKRLYIINETDSGAISLTKVKDLSNATSADRMVYHNGLLYYTDGNKAYTYNMDTGQEITYSGIVPSSVSRLQPVKCNDRICLIGSDKNIYDFETTEVIGTVDDTPKLGTDYTDKHFDNLCQLYNSIMIYKDLEYQTIPLGVDFVSYSYKYQIYAYVTTDGNAHICRIGTNEEILSFKGNFIYFALFEDYILLSENQSCKAYQLLLLNKSTETE